MGCQQICQNSDVDKKYIIADTGSKSAQNVNRSKAAKNSRNVKENDLNNYVSNNKSLNESAYRCSLNIQETLVLKDMLRITIKASNVHKMIPIWIDKYTTVSFKVAGEWGFFEHNELFDSLGCPSFEEKPNNMNFGSLVGYIPGEPYFAVYDGMQIVPEKDGPLYLFQNNGLYSVNPRGSLEIEIKGGTPMSLYEIEKQLGWDLGNLDTSIPEMKEDEVALLILLNKVRTNPKLFAQQYLINTGKAVENELEEVLNTMDVLPVLSTNKKVYEISRNHAIDLGQNKIAGHTSSNGLNMEQRLQQGGINTKVFAENCIFGYNDPLEIILRLLIDEDNENRNQRKIILSKDFNIVGISIEPHSGEFCWSCIQDFIFEQNND